MNRAEYDKLAMAASAEGQPLSVLVRDRALGVAPQSQRSILEDDAHRQVVYVLNNLTQLLRAADSGEVDGLEHIERAREHAGQLYRKLGRGDDREPVTLNPEAIDDLRAEGHILNSLARRANVGRHVDGDELQQSLSGILTALRRLIDGGAA